jgi:hypothetical protein
MVVLRAHRSVYIVTTIVSTSDLAKDNGLQLKVERLDRQPSAPRKPSIASNQAVTLPAAAPIKPAPSMLEIVETGPRTASAASVPRSVVPTFEAAVVPRVESAAAAGPRTRIPTIAVGLLVEGARAWRIGTIESLPEIQNEVIVGVRLAVREDRASSYQLRLVARLSDGRLREALGHDVRAEAIGNTSIYGVAAQYRGPDNAGWMPLCDVDFLQVS